MITYEQKRAALKALQDEFGVIRAEDLLEAARDPDHPYHHAFHFDDEAGMAHANRMNIARKIITSFRITVSIQDRPVRCVGYVSDPSKLVHDQGYKAVTAITRKSDEARLVMESELDRVEALLRRSRALAEVLNLEKYYDNMLETLAIVRGMMPPSAGGGKGKEKGKGARR